MANNYNREHWRKKIADYLTEEWSTSPSPFAQTAAKHFKLGSKILELGTGAGQDGLWFEEQGFYVVLTDGTPDAFDVVQQKSKKQTRPIQFDITEKFPFEDSHFDVVYAQLVLHYFDDDMMTQIMGEVYRVLSDGGILAFMVNTVEDPEYKGSGSNNTGMIQTDKLLKRYFSMETLKPFVANFDAILFDNKGRTPKDDEIGNSGMIQYIGRKK